MNINKVRINGFASFHNFEITLNTGENIIVGTNGTGKSNFLDIIATAISSDYQQLSDFVYERTADAYIQIELNLNEKGKHLFMKLFTFYIAVKLSFPNSLMYTSANLDTIIKYLLNLNLFKDPILLKCSYYNKKIIRIIKFNFCEECCAENLFDIFTGHNKDCTIHKIYQYVMCINGHMNSFHTLDISQIESYIDKIQKVDILQHTTNCTIPEIIKKYYKFELNMINNTFVTKYESRDKYIHEYFIPLMNDVFKNNEILQFFEQWMENEFDADNVTILNLINLLSQNNIMNTTINNFISDSLNYISMSEYVHNFEIYQKLMIYDNEITKNRTIQENSINLLKGNNILNDFLNEINPEEEIRKSLYENSKLSIAQKVFKKITNKYFKISCEYEANYFPTYHYEVTSDDFKMNLDPNFEPTYYNCSYGERELINFMSQYYCDTSSIIVVDEICSHLSSQSKINFRNMFLRNVKNKQIILVTHDVEIVDPDNNLIHFRIENNKTIATNLKTDLQENNFIKVLKENPSILFSSKCLFVEGYNDKRVFDVFCSINENYDYNIVPLGGKHTQSWKICDKLQIPYKIIYDNDKLTDFMMEKYNKDSIFSKYISDEKHKWIEVIKNEKNISSNIFLELCQNEAMKFKTLSKASIKALFITLDFFGSTNKFGIDILFDKNSCPNTPFSDNIVHLERMKKMDIMRNISYTEFIDKYKEIYQSIANEFLEKCNKNLTGVDSFIDRFSKVYIKCDAIKRDNKMIIQLFDDIINENFKMAKIFVWNSNYNDLEGFMSAMVGEQIHKSIWKNITREQIEKVISDFNKNDILYNELKHFLCHSIK
jgi:ABC-type lipoprotein export system ATPase subunit